MMTDDVTHARFTVDSELYSRWKDTVPRSKTLDEAFEDLLAEEVD